jgi:hypothetical protein
MLESAILVLLYNKEIAESSTISSLIDSNVQYSNARIVIWNNGPEYLKSIDSTCLENLGYDVVIKETLSNESLAVIYNNFISENKADKYILLDDDSILNASYVLASSKSNTTDVGMPIISVAGSVQSPQIDAQPYFPEIVFTSKNKVITIGSGLVIGSDVVEFLNKNYNSVFDERFYLYGVDTTFCLRLFESKLTKIIKIIPGFNHYLSRLEKEDIKKTDFRRLERSYAFGLEQRFYSPLLDAFFTILKVSASTIKKRLFRKPYIVSIFPLLKAFLSGKHYRYRK